MKDIIPLEEVQLESDLTYEEKPIKILETAERVTRTKTIKFCKVQWNHHSEEEATWEREDDLRKDHPHLFASQSESRGRDSPLGGYICNIPKIIISKFAYHSCMHIDLRLNFKLISEKQKHLVV